MKLHKYKDEFKSLISIVANKLHIPESAVERDYYIVLLLKKLENSEYVEKCVFINIVATCLCIWNYFLGY